MKVSEMFAGLQGEGASIGIPAAFIRLANCNLACKWCDTISVWPKGEEISPDDVAKQAIELAGGRSALESGTSHLVLTGGEPTIRYHFDEIVALLDAFGKYLDRYFIELETNGTSEWPLYHRFDQINCSPKLANSGESKERRINFRALDLIDSTRNSWFKFVITSPDDWKEIENDFLPYIHRSKVILMPAGVDRDELISNSRMVWEIAMREKVRATTRLQTISWNNMHGK